MRAEDVKRNALEELDKLYPLVIELRDRVKKLEGQVKANGIWHKKF